MKRLLLTFVTTVFVSYFVRAQSVSTAQLDALSQKYVRESYRDLYDFLALPNNAHIESQIPPNIEWLKKAFAQRGFTTEILSTKGPNSLFYAEHKASVPPRSNIQ